MLATRVSMGQVESDWDRAEAYLGLLLLLENKTKTVSN